jgi:hypothetical protein
MRLNELSSEVRDAVYQQWGRIFQDHIRAGRSFAEARWFTTESVKDLYRYREQKNDHNRNSALFQRR